MWRPMFEAPRTGEIIVCLYPDLSGVDLQRWGIDKETGEGGWYNTRYTRDGVQDDFWTAWACIPVVMFEGRDVLLDDGSSERDEATARRP